VVVLRKTGGEECPFCSQILPSLGPCRIVHSQIRSTVFELMACVARRIKQLHISADIRWEASRPPPWVRARVVAPGIAAMLLRPDKVEHFGYDVVLS